MEEKEISIEIKKPEIWVLIAFIAFVFFLELQITLNSPIAFGDEGFHTRMSQWIGQEKEYPVWIPFEGSKLEREGFSRPPLWNILEGSFYFMFGFNDIIVRVLTPLIASVLIGLATYLLVKRVYDGKIALIASMITITIPSFVTYSVLFYDAILLAFFFVLFILTMVLAVKNNGKKYWLLSGIFAALAYLSKGSGLAIIPLVVLIFVYLWTREKKFVKSLKVFLPFIVVLLLLLAPFLLRNYFYYGTPDCRFWFFDLKRCEIDNYQDKLQFSARTEQTGTEQSILNIGLLGYLDFAYGNVWIVVFSFMAGLTIFFARRHSTDVLVLLALLMLIPIVAESFNRAEDTARATIAWVPFIALISATFFNELYSFIKNYRVYIAAIVFLFVILYTLFGLGLRGYGVYDKLFGYDTVQNGQSVHVGGLKDVKQFSTMFFDACNFVKANVTQNALIMTVWGHHTTYNCQRNTFGNLADIVLSDNVTSMLDVAKQHGITHIFVQKFSLSDEPLQERYTISFVQILENNPDHFNKIFENGVPLQQCVQQGGCDGNIIYEIKF